MGLKSGGTSFARKGTGIAGALVFITVLLSLPSVSAISVSPQTAPASAFYKFTPPFGPSGLAPIASVTYSNLTSAGLGGCLVPAPGPTEPVKAAMSAKTGKGQTTVASHGQFASGCYYSYEALTVTVASIGLGGFKFVMPSAPSYGISVTWSDAFAGALSIIPNGTSWNSSGGAYTANYLVAMRFDLTNLNNSYTINMYPGFPTDPNPTVGVNQTYNFSQAWTKHTSSSGRLNPRAIVPGDYYELNVYLWLRLYNTAISYGGALPYGTTFNSSLDFSHAHGYGVKIQSITIS